MMYQIFHSMEWTYPDTVPSDEGEKSIKLLSARGSYACCQMILDGGLDGKVSCQYISAGYSPDFMNHPEVYQLIPVYVEKNTGPNGFTVVDGESAESYTTRPAPFWVYDAMKPIAAEEIFESNGRTNTGIFLSWKIPADAKPGIYSGELHLKFNQQELRIPVSVEVSAAVVPEKETLGIINWFGLKIMADYHGLAPWSEEHWDMIRQYGLLMRRGRQNYFWVNKEAVDVTENGDGTYSFSFERAERLIRMYFDLGFSYIEGGMAIERLYYEASDFIIRINDTHIKALSKEGYQYLHDYFKAWREFLIRNGWLDKVVQHVADEPHDGCKEEYRILAGIVRKLMPDVPLIDAVEIFGLDGALDIWVPKNHFFENNREEFERLRRLGDRLWFYTCCHPGGHYMNRLLDMHLLRTRYLHWGNYIYNIEGYLHWGLNFYDCTEDPFNGRAGQIASLSQMSLPPGDTHILYPGGSCPWGSVRLEAMRAGIEDYEMLRSLAATDKSAADKIAESCVRGFSDCKEDTVGFNESYRRLLDAISSCTT